MQSMIMLVGKSLMAKRTDPYLKKSMLKMKFLFILMLLFSLQSQAKVVAQQIDLTVKQEKLTSVFKIIKQKTGYNFFFNESMIAAAKPVTMDINDGTLENVLDQCFAGQPFTYAIVEKLIVVKEKSSTPKSIQQELKIHGFVKDSAGAPIGGATVLNTKTNKGTITTSSGEFTVVANEGDILEFSYIGYDTKSVTVGKETEINVELSAAASTLSDLVVVGYGKQKKENLTGAVGVVNAKEIENRPVTSVGNALQGTLAGVAVTASSSGQPGNDAGTIRVRGIGTLNNSNAMVVVDGVISTMNNVNPDDIESISVLKDAASAAIYGSRAANGVILITTKRGKKGKAQISYSGYVGKQKATALPDFLPSWQAAGLYNQALTNEGKGPRWTDDEIQLFKDGSDPFHYPNTDWLGLFYKGNGIQQSHHIGISGGTENTQYAFSLGIFNENGIVDKTNAKRYTTRFNINSKIAEHLTATGSIAFTYSGKEEPSNPYTGDFSQLVRQINRISPTIPYKFENGNYGHISDGSPMAWLEGNSFNHFQYYDLVGNATLDWEITHGLHFKPSISYVMGIEHSKNFAADQQYFDEDGTPSFYQGPNSAKDVNSFNNVVTFQDLLEYTTSFGAHHFNILGGYSQEYTKFTYDDGFRKGFLNNDLSDINLGSTDGQTTSGYSYDLGLRSVFGRLNYDYDNKYLFEANLRYDGSSRFASENRWGLFPSFSAGWNIDKEAFFEGLKPVVSNLKLRASWGKLGNQNIVVSSANIDEEYYPYITTIHPGQDYTFGGPGAIIASGISPIVGANADIQWEATREYGVGIDATFFQNKLSFTADYFDKLTTGILMALPVSATYGLDAPIQNAGAVLNKGWEFTLGYNDKKGAFNYFANLNASFVHNEITDLHGTGPTTSGYTVRQEGLPINALYGYVSEGIFQTDEEAANHAYQSVNTAAGDLIYKDLDGNDTINSADRQYIGNYYPKVTFGLNLGGSWRNFDVSVLLQGAAGVKTYLDVGKLGSVSADAAKPTSALLDTWTPENTGAAFPRIWYAYNQNDPTITPSSYWVRNGSYLRLKNLQVGYTLPESLTQKAGISKLRIYYSGQNILTFDSLFDWVDPEQAATSSIYYYPQVKLHTIGLNVTF